MFGWAFNRLNARSRPLNTSLYKFWVVWYYGTKIYFALNLSLEPPWLSVASAHIDFALPLSLWFTFLFFLWYPFSILFTFSSWMFRLYFFFHLLHPRSLFVLSGWRNKHGERRRYSLSVLSLRHLALFLSMRNEDQIWCLETSNLTLMVLTWGEVKLLS